MKSAIIGKEESPNARMGDFEQMWSEIFALGAPVAREDSAARSSFISFLVLLLRVFGKRELAQLNPFDLVVLLSLSNTVQNAIIGNDNSLTGGLIGAFTLLAVNYLVVRFLFRHRRLDQIFEGKPTTLMEHGKLVKGALAKELLTRAELTTVLHRQGFDGLERRGALRARTGRRLLYPAEIAAGRRSAARRDDCQADRARRQARPPAGPAGRRVTGGACFGLP